MTSQNTSLKPLEIDDIEGVLSTLDAAFFDIPFENSDFQNTMFVVAAQQTPARAYRAIGLRMFSKIRAVKEYLIQNERNKIDREEKEAKLNDPDTSEFDKRRLRLDILQLDEGKTWGEKLLNDSLRELDCLHREFKKFPRYTREMFEMEEKTHFEARLNRQLQADGAMDALLNMNQDAPQLEASLKAINTLLAPSANQTKSLA
jgi:hypothetical protein